MTIQGIGIDVTDISRVRKILRSGKNRFIANTFTKSEQDYCNSFKDPAPHYAGTFAAKEAVRKLSVKYVLPMSDIEVRHRKTGAPEVWIRGKKAKRLYISITHGTRDAFAVAVEQS